MALPFALSYLGKAAATNTQRHKQIAILGATELIMWLALLRFAVPTLVGSRSLLLLFSLATIAFTWLGLRRLSTGDRFAPQSAP